MDHNTADFFSTCINFFKSVLTQIAYISKTPQESCVKTIGFMGVINNQAFFTLGLVYIFLKYDTGSTLI